MKIIYPVLPSVVYVGGWNRAMEDLNRMAMEHVKWGHDEKYSKQRIWPFDESRRAK